MGERIQTNLSELKNSRLRDSQEWEKDSGKLAWSGGSYAWHKSNPTFWDEFWTQVLHLDNYIGQVVKHL